MIAVLPPMVPKVEFKNLAEFLVAFEDIKPVSGGIASYGTPAAYALVWELGAMSRMYPGPKTMWSTNALGEKTILTRQAPHGYVRIHEKDFWPILRRELSEIKFTHCKTAREIELRLEIAIDNASQAFARLVSDTAPVDSGDLRASIQYVEASAGDKNFATFDVGDSNEEEGYGTFIL